MTDIAPLTTFRGIIQLLFHFGLKQASACIFGICLLIAMILTRMIWQESWALARYDALLFIAIALQVLFLKTGIETISEARVILLFHITGTAMEIFKVHAGSWSYPDPSIIRIYDVPLYTGFMYAAVGSYMARVVRLFDMEMAPFPPLWLHYGLATLVYINFFSHHFIIDIRYFLFAATIILYGRTQIWFRVRRRWLWMPLPLAAFFSSFFLWIAENIGTATGTWLYSGQSAFEMVRFAKMGAWYLLLYVSFATVTLVVRVTPREGAENRPMRRYSRPRFTKT
ncbi:uncharacterized membrane protein YoaT (DUF817 family) [Loktanella ponticola]|uniref:Uncharacterized membrane protein YoaT (DUF817 family) n=1 Tax=Yoonia ponticola TaxID=1524255 RepID=A0A7W9BLE5_9RHOB|nr:DUF817 domain-containing protein [Yoonia ponticola]MBB5722506.1 uncharacterized membrane protein YoaT (DUF817 family) [Yoonia ponticola]